MPTTVSGIGTLAISSPGSLKIVIDAKPSYAGMGESNPPAYYGLGMLRLGTAQGYLPPFSLTTDTQLVPCPNGATILGYALHTGVTITVTERAEQPYAGPTGPPGATGATGAAGGSAANYSCKLRHSATQTIATGSLSVLTWNTEDFDTDAMHDPTTNPQRITIVHAGLYLVTAFLNWAAAATGVRLTTLSINTTDYQQVAMSPATASFGGGVPMVYLGRLAAGDYLQIKALHDGGANRTVNADSTFAAVMLQP